MDEHEIVEEGGIEMDVDMAYKRGSS